MPVTFQIDFSGRCISQLDCRNHYTKLIPIATNVYWWLLTLIKSHCSVLPIFYCLPSSETGGYQDAVSSIMKESERKWKFSLKFTSIHSGFLSTRAWEHLMYGKQKAVTFNNIQQGNIGLCVKNSPQKTDLAFYQCMVHCCMNKEAWAWAGTFHPSRSHMRWGDMKLPFPALCCCIWTWETVVCPNTSSLNPSQQNTKVRLPCLKHNQPATYHNSKLLL